eukprot:jgi/Mesen1/377/ME000010S_10832
MSSIGSTLLSPFSLPEGAGSPDLQVDPSDPVQGSLDSFKSASFDQDWSDGPDTIEEEVKTIVGKAKEKLESICAANSTSPALDKFCVFQGEFPEVAPLLVLSKLEINPVSVAVVRSALTAPCSTAPNATRHVQRHLSHVHMMSLRLQEDGSLEHEVAAAGSNSRAVEDVDADSSDAVGAEEGNPDEPDENKHAHGYGHGPGPHGKPCEHKGICLACVKRGFQVLRRRVIQKIFLVCLNTDDEHVRAACHFAAQHKYLTRTALLLKLKPWDIVAHSLLILPLALALGALVVDSPPLAPTPALGDPVVASPPLALALALGALVNFLPLAPALVLGALVVDSPPLALTLDPGALVVASPPSAQGLALGALVDSPLPLGPGLPLGLVALGDPGPFGPQGPWNYPHEGPYGPFGSSDGAHAPEQQSEGGTANGYAGNSFEGAGNAEVVDNGPDFRPQSGPSFLSDGELGDSWQDPAIAMWQGQQAVAAAAGSRKPARDEPIARRMMRDAGKPGRHSGAHGRPAGAEEEKPPDEEERMAGFPGEAEMEDLPKAGDGFGSSMATASMAAGEESFGDVEQTNSAPQDSNDPVIEEETDSGGALTFPLI